MEAKRKGWAVLKLMTAMAMVGANVALGKVIIAEVSIFLFSILRFAIAVLTLLPLVFLFDSRHWSLTRGEHASLFLQAFFGVFVFHLCMLYGVQYTSAINAGILTSTLPAMVAIFSWLLLREVLRGKIVLAIVLAIVGTLILNSQVNGSEQSSAPLLGNSLILIAVAGEALYTIFAKKLSNRLSPLKMALAVNLLGFLLFLPLAWGEITLSNLLAVSAEMWGWMIYYSLTASVISLVLWYSGVRDVPAQYAGLFTAMIPVAAVLVSILLLGELMRWYHWVGGGVILASLWLGMPKRVKATKTPN
ncbi:DMT family transporter [Balneatrix alpica]|uniref:DMT family transporter n=1 Tax=Balneatrix alpica TaxID=75684 RepID=A0ABV5ZG04_9GAMM|nr:EamA family transporter [Balneatrix alpica]